eukprot:8512712-Ditylum_brightwellii.AAC.1
MLNESRDADANEASNTSQKDVCDISSDIISDINPCLHLLWAIVPGVDDMHDRLGHWLVDMDQLTNVMREKFYCKQCKTK